MTEFFNNFKKTFFAHFPLFYGKKKFQKNLTVMHNFISVSNTMSEFR